MQRFYQNIPFAQETDNICKIPVHTKTKQICQRIYGLWFNEVWRLINSYSDLYTKL